MKKIVTLLLAAVMLLALAACGNGGNETTANGGDTTASPAVESKDPLAVLQTVWASYGDDEKFAVAGGDMSEENSKMDEPGVFSLENKEELDATLGLSAEAAEKVDSAASLVHMMNANTFTCGAFKVKNAEDVASLAGLLKDNILKRQWMCGFPDKLVVASVDDVVLAFFGKNDNIDTFKAKLTEAYASAEVISESPIE
ncbi:MAG: hypothetical protein ACI4F5_00015 [Acutalibacteraceae bacterium]